MDNEATLRYVNSTAAMLGIPMDGARAERVAGHLQRTRAIADLLESAELSASDELAEIYCPRAFKVNEYVREQL
jgi:Protein of unknown function (DUF4089)